MGLAIMVMSRVFFVVLLALAFVIGFASLIAYPGPFVLVAFTLGGLPWVRVQRGEWIVAGALAALPWLMPAYLLTMYTLDGDFTVAALVAQWMVLGLFAYGSALVGQGLGKVIWQPWGGALSAGRGTERS